MVRQRYTGISDPRAAFEALRPLDRELLALMQRVKPMGPDYFVLNAVRKALSTAAYHFTGHPEFYSAAPPRSFGPPRDEEP